jgi:hypothetical protein
MGLVRTALIFGAGYVLGRPEGRAKVAELTKRPEVAQLRQQAASTVSTGLEVGKRKVAEATGKATDRVSEKKSAQADGLDTKAGTGGWRGRRVPSFPRRGVRRAAPAASRTGPPSTATGPATGGTDPVSTDTVSPGTTSAVSTPAGTTPRGTADAAGAPRVSGADE